MAAAAPAPLSGEGSTMDKIRSDLHRTLARVRAKVKTDRHNPSSAIFKMRTRCEQNAAQRQEWLDEDDAEKASLTPKNGTKPLT